MLRQNFTNSVLKKYETRDILKNVKSHKLCIKVNIINKAYCTNERNLAYKFVFHIKFPG